MLLARGEEVGRSGEVEMGQLHEGESPLVPPTTLHVCAAQQIAIDLSMARGTQWDEAFANTRNWTAGSVWDRNL